jgi:hypothetical protein
VHQGFGEIDRMPFKMKEKLFIVYFSGATDRIVRNWREVDDSKLLP